MCNFCKTEKIEKPKNVISLPKKAWLNKEVREKREEENYIRRAIKDTKDIVEKIDKQLTSKIKEEAQENMKCCKCGKKIDVPATYIKMENATDKNLNRILAVCHNCAYGMINKGAEVDPILMQ